jgi:hypothetical protein
MTSVIGDPGLRSAAQSFKFASLLKNVMCQKILALSNRKLNDDKTSQNNILHTSIASYCSFNPENLKFDPHGIASFLRYYNQRV